MTKPVLALVQEAHTAIIVHEVSAIELLSDVSRNLV